MHELAIAFNIVDIAARAADGRKVSRVLIDVGALTGISIEALAFCFPEAARGTALEESRLDIREIEGRARCASCGAEFPTPHVWSACPCGSIRFERLRGEELQVESIELAEAL